MFDNKFSEEKYKRILTDSIITFGHDSQVFKLFEEIGEFMQALVKLKMHIMETGSDINRFDAEKAAMLLEKLYVERCDIEILLKQIDLMFHLTETDLEPTLEFQLKRLKDKLNEKA